MTRLRQIMLEELQRRNYAPSTIRYYAHNVEQFARHFKRPPDRLTPTHLRTHQAYLLRERKLAPGTVQLYVCAIRFFFNKAARHRHDRYRIHSGRPTARSKLSLPENWPDRRGIRASRWRFPRPQLH